MEISNKTFDELIKLENLTKKTDPIIWLNEPRKKAIKDEKSRESLNEEREYFQDLYH